MFFVIKKQQKTKPVFFKPVYPNMFAKKFKFMENYNFWTMYLQVKILTLDIFTHMLPPLPTLLPPITPAVSGGHDMEYWVILYL